MNTNRPWGGRCLRGKLAAILVSVSLSFAPGARLAAQTLSGWLTEYAHPAYATVSSQFRMDQLKLDGVTYMGGSANLFCADLPGTSIDEDITSYPHYLASFTVGAMSQMTVWSRYSNAQNEPLAQAMAHWVVDNYYLNYFLQPANNVNERQYAFQNVLWEVFGDGGTSAGLSFSTGNVIRSKFGPSGSNDSPQLWAYMNQMINGLNNAGVTVNYDPVYQVVAVLDSRSAYQDYLLVPINYVPEPSTGLLLMLGLAFAVPRRRRGGASGIRAGGRADG